MFPGFSTVSAAPARVSYFKGCVYVTGSTEALGAGAPPSDMLTVRYLVYDPWPWPQPQNQVLHGQFDFLNGVTSGASRDDFSVDMAMIVPLAVSGVGGYLAITGSSVDVSTGKSEAATVLYDWGLNPIWEYGARWGRPVGGGGNDLDAGVCVRLIEAPNEGNQEPQDASLNVYVATMTASISGGLDYTLLKYFNTAPNPGPDKDIDWLEQNLPYFNNASVNGHDIPVKLFAELQPVGLSAIRS